MEMAEDLTVDTAKAQQKGRSLWQDAWYRLNKDKWAMTCLYIVVFYILVAIAVKLGWLAADWEKEVGGSHQAPSMDGWRLWFGTDIFGRSVLLKTIFGAYVSMSVAVFSTLICVPIGVTLGALAGYFGSWVDDLITWFYTTISNIPYILLLVAMAFIMESKGIFSMTLALGLTSWVGICRLIRGEFLKHKDREYVQAAKSLGGGHGRRIFLHILPNVTHMVIIQMSFLFISAILTEVILSYLGLGVEGMPSWGTMIDEAKLELAQGKWWQMAAASSAIFFVALALNILGDALRDCLDPKLR